MYQGILHASVIIADVQTSLKFYVDGLGLTLNPDRPDLGYPGAWLTIGEQEIHLLEVPNPDPVTGRPEHGGRDRHVALAVTDFEALITRLDEMNTPYSMSRSGRKALFCRDPDGNGLEFIAT